MPFASLWRNVEVEEDPTPQEELARLRRVQRTAKAREAATKARLSKAGSFEKGGNAGTCTGTPLETRTSILQRNYFTRHLFNPQGVSKEHDYQKMGSERARCTFSLVKYIITMVQQLFKGCDGQPVQHVISVVIADDTDTRLKGAGLRSTIHSVCNTVQYAHFRYSPAGKQECWETVNIPTPMLVLASPQAGDIHAASTAMSLVCGHVIGGMLQKFGLAEQDVAPLHAFRTEVVVGDALQANAASWKIERRLLGSLREKADHERVSAIQVQCLVHQLNLIRKPMVLSISGFWATLVRMAHCFEAFSFRQSFVASLVQVLQSEDFQCS